VGTCRVSSYFASRAETLHECALGREWVFSWLPHSFGGEVRALAKKPVIVKPGQKAPVSGQYKPVKGGPEVTIPKGHRVPPTPNGGGQKLVDPTKNKSGR